MTRLRIALREAPAANVGHDDPVVRGQVWRQVLEVTAVARQTMQAKHHRRARGACRVHATEESQTIVTLKPIFGVPHVEGSFLAVA